MALILAVQLGIDMLIGRRGVYGGRPRILERGALTAREASENFLQAMPTIWQSSSASE